MTRKTERPRKAPPVSLSGTFISPDQVCDMLGISRATLDRDVAAGRFPPPVKFGKRRNRWRTAIVEQHLRSLEAAAAK